MNFKPNYNASCLCLQTSTKTPGISMHKFPKNIEQRIAWLAACGIFTNYFQEFRRICSLHFEEHCFNGYNMQMCLNPRSILTIFNDIIPSQKPRRKSKYSILASKYYQSRQLPSYVQYDDGSLEKIIHSSYGSPSSKNSLLQIVSPVCDDSSVDDDSPERDDSSLDDDSPEHDVSSVGDGSPVCDNSPVRNTSPLPLPKEKLFCPITMMRYDNLSIEYSSIWLCRICMSAQLSENAAQTHFATCKLPIEMSDIKEEEEYDENSEIEDNNMDEDDIIILGDN